MVVLDLDLEFLQYADEIGTLLELKGEVVFKTRAYANAARTLESLNEPLDKLIAENRLGEIKGIGEALQKKSPNWPRPASWPITTNSRLPFRRAGGNAADSGAGPEESQGAQRQTGRGNRRAIGRRARTARWRSWTVSAKNAGQILEGIQFRRQYASRHLLSDALVRRPSRSWKVCARIRTWCVAARRAACGVARKSSATLICWLPPKSRGGDRFFHQQPGVMSVSAKGETKASVILTGGIQADLRVVSDAEFPFALLYFTGSKEHNIVMRQRAIQRGLRLNEYGLFKSEVETRDPKLLVACRTEEEIFQKLGLDYIPPELREDAGEFAAAEKTLPRLLEWTQLKGSLHNHSNWSDGRGTLEEIAEYMQELGCEYWAITDHSKSSFQANGLQPERLRQQIKEIRALNKN
jgi:DNA polymerase (family X)